MRRTPVRVLAQDLYRAMDEFAVTIAFVVCAQAEEAWECGRAAAMRDLGMPPNTISTWEHLSSSRRREMAQTMYPLMTIGGLP